MRESIEEKQRHLKSINWRALQYFNIYRILISGLFVVLIHLGQLLQPLGSLDPRLFSIASHVYLFLAIAFSFCILKRYPRFNLQIAEIPRLWC